MGMVGYALTVLGVILYGEAKKRFSWVALQDSEKLYACLEHIFGARCPSLCFYYYLGTEKRKVPEKKIDPIEAHQQIAA